MAVGKHFGTPPDRYGTLIPIIVFRTLSVSLALMKIITQGKLPCIGMPYNGTTELRLFAAVELVQTCPWRIPASGRYRKLKKPTTMFLPPVANDINAFSGA